MGALGGVGAGLRERVGWRVGGRAHRRVGGRAEGGERAHAPRRAALVSFFSCAVFRSPVLCWIRFWLRGVFLFKNGGGNKEKEDEEEEEVWSRSKMNKGVGGWLFLCLEAGVSFRRRPLHRPC